MNLTKEKLLCLWNNREQIFKDKKNAEIIERFNAVRDLFEEVEKKEVTYDETSRAVKIGEDVLKKVDRDSPSLEYFGSALDGWLVGSDKGGGRRNITNQMDLFPDYKDLVRELCCVLTGMDFKSNVYDCRQYDKYLLLSNTSKKEHDNGALNTDKNSGWNAAHFGTNNYFFNVISTINQIKNDSFNPDESRMVLIWPGQTEKDWDKDDAKRENAEKAQRKALKRRFPYKFFYMWTHRDSCIHLLSLMPYQKLAKCGDDCKHEDPNIDMDFEIFADAMQERGWQKYSEKIAGYIPEEKKGDNFWEKMSKLLSIVAINEDQSIRNTEELLSTGNQAIILWGPPGTSKTYTAEMLVKSMLETESLEDVKFPKQSEKGCYELVQFHPNYAYEDFIGGIAPQVTGNTLAYTLKEGVFKKFCDQANKNTGKKYIFIIDEINRADLSSVFGELLYALEKRGQGVSIPNFTENDYKFVIPQNVYLIGTMNNVDKSLVSFDLALRRRFSFVKMMPDLSVLDTMLTGYSVSKDVTNSVEVENLVAYIGRCEDLNNRIRTSQTLGLNENYQIGQAYFMKIKDFLPDVENEGYVKITTLELEKLWEYHLLPLIEEYLGARAEDVDVKRKLENLKSEFIQVL